MQPYKVFISTNNKDKLQIVSAIFASHLPTNHQILSPRDIGYSKSVEEVGSIENRAKDKAKQAYLDLKEGFDLVVGIDDGIRIENENQTYAESQEATARILEGNMIYAGDRITVERAFHFITNAGLEISCNTRIPFIFLGNSNNIAMETDTYPLNYVLSYVEMSTPIASMSKEETDKLDIEYTKKDLELIFKALLNN